MKIRSVVIVILTLLTCSTVLAVPPCWPKQLGSTGSDFKRGHTADGQWIAWTCTARGVKTVYGAWAVHDYTIQHPDITGLTPSRAARAYWEANVLDESDEKLDRLKQAARAAFE